MPGHMRTMTDITIGGFEWEGEFAAIDLIAASRNALTWGRPELKELGLLFERFGGDVTVAEERAPRTRTEQRSQQSAPPAPVRPRRPPTARTTRGAPAATWWSPLSLGGITAALVVAQAWLIANTISDVVIQPPGAGAGPHAGGAARWW